MAVNEDIREMLYPDSVVFDNPAYDNSIIGTNISSGAAVYSYERMIEEMMHDEGLSYEDACDFIDFNTVRSLPYANKFGTPPEIVSTDIIELTRSRQ